MAQPVAPMLEDPKYSRANWFFWSDTEKERVATYEDKYAYGPNTFLEQLLLPVMESIAAQVPETVAPNVLTMAGLVTLIHGAYLATNHASAFPVPVCIACTILVTAYYILDAIDGLHAKRIRNDSNLGGLMVVSVNAVAPVFLMVIFCKCVLGVQSLDTLWYAVQSGVLFFLYIHIRELHGTSKNFVRWFIPGPSSLVPMFPLFLLGRAAFAFVSQSPADLFELQWNKFVTWFMAVLEEKVPMFSDTINLERIKLHPTEQDVYRGFLTLYCISLVSVFVALTMAHKTGKKRDRSDVTHRSTPTRLMICMIYRIVPATMIRLGLWSEVTMTTVLVDGIFVAVLQTDMVLSRMAGRALHPWVIIFCMISVLDQFVEACLCGFYYASIFYDLSEYMNLPLFTVVKNVYVDGVYDLCHIGHKKMFKEAAAFGNRLFVGVVNDEEATPYKRKPVMTHEERCQEVGACKYVAKVIPHAPCNGIPEEFIHKHKIHVVVCGEEYFTNPNDKYYAVPRKMGILQAAPRTKGMSTSALIQRILDSDPKALAAKDKLRGESLVKDEPAGAPPAFRNTPISSPSNKGDIG